MYKPVTLITGASSGIGVELAKVFATNDGDVALVARREAQLNEVADAIAASGRARPHVVAIDLARADSPARISHELLTRGLEPAVIVNNAGFGLLGDAAEIDRGEQLAMIDLNVRTLTDLSLRWIDSVTRHGGGILNVASVAGFLPGPGMAVYYATKAYVLSFTTALHRELQPRGVRVTALCPGPVSTGFQARAGIRSGRSTGLLGCSAERVAREGYEGLIRGKAVVVPGLANKVVTFLPRILPRALVLTMVHNNQRGRNAPVAEEWPRRRA
ncbi:MAG TPA: SDR family oxidoreductase [Xanthobacteraceae bacterium]|nr:SDR family oxidoreductase [Xanthobacteraceae bacterium]